MQGLVRLGGKGHKLVILHATGFLGAAYTPLAAALQDRFDCYTLDFPGHGAASSVTLPKVTVGACVEYLVDSIESSGLHGCFCIGHSAGGAFALKAAARVPGIFAAIYCFEAVVSTPQTHAFLSEAMDKHLITTAGQILASLARKRRECFSSRETALQHLVKKQPFASMHPQAVQCFVQHGLTGVEQAGMQQTARHFQQQQHVGQSHWQQQQQDSLRLKGAALQAHAQAVDAAQTKQPHSTVNGSFQHRHQQQQLQQVHQQHHQRKQHWLKPCQVGDIVSEGEVSLVCSPAVEASYYEALDPPPAVPPGAVSCPVVMAISGGANGSSMEQFAQHESVKQWLLHNPAQRQQQQQKPSLQGDKASEGIVEDSRQQQAVQQDPLHGVLAVLNIELAAAMPTATLAKVAGVSHFGPLEHPQHFAERCMQFFP